MADLKVAETEPTEPTDPCEPTWGDVWGWIKFVAALAFYKGIQRISRLGGAAAVAIILALVLGACGAPAPAGGPEVEEPTAGDTGPDTTPPAPDAAPPVQPDAQPAPPAPDAGREAAPQPQPGPDAGGSDSAPAAADAAPAVDAAPAADAAPAQVCDSPEASCQAAVKADNEIAATFPQACTTSERQCGGVYEDGHIVVTYPMLCMAGRWRLAGSWYGDTWVPAYSCSRGCGAAGVLCQP